MIFVPSSYQTFSPMTKKLLLLLITSFFFQFLAAQSKKRPNIIYIMADDMGYADLSCYGRNDYQTPHLDKLASQGIKFTNAYAGAPVCTPSRASFMTGRYPARTPVGMPEPLGWWDTVGLTPKYTSLPTLLKKAGYETFLIGKWHLGGLAAFSPLQNGFDYFFGFTGGAIDYTSHTNPRGENDLWENDKLVSKDGYMTDLLMNKAIDVLKKNHDKPFFISLQFSAPHWPWQAPGDKAYPASDTAKDAREWGKGGSPQTYAAMVKSMDDAIGKILEALDEAKLTSNTVIIFTSDNGGERFSDMGGFARKKMTLWEGGIREPAFVKWTGVIPANTVTDQPVITMDWTATILALANAKPDAAFPLDGINLMPLMTGRAKPAIRTFYWRTIRVPQKAMREGNWKYLKEGDKEYLFDLSKDAGEKNDLKESQKEIFEKLKHKYGEWEKTVLTPPISQL
jgi:arylsulfatase A-like enzyme